MNNPWKQNYANYTKANQKVWRTLYDRQMEILPTVAATNVLEGLEVVRFSNRRIPEFEKVNKRLARATGWQLQEVPSLIPVRDFFLMLSQKRFPATTWLREMEHLDYLEEPDMFHDVFGHAPLLANRRFCEFLDGMSRLAANYSNTPQALDILGRLYWHTVEFGLVREYGEKKIYGAGILSSHGETLHCLGTSPQLVPFDVASVLQNDFRMDTFQPSYFVIQSFDQLYHSLAEVDFHLAKMLSASRRNVA
jgi:phenylalanine-4-hydroxylase